MQVEVRDVRPELARTRDTDQGVHVGAVDVDLAAGLVDQLAQLDDGVLVDAVGRGIGHHDRREHLAVLLDLAAQVLHVDRAAGRGLDHDDLEARHHRGRRVGAVGAGRDEADIALLLPVRAVVGADRHEAGQLAGRAGVGLHRHGVVAGDLHEPLLQVRDDLARARRLVGRHEGVQGRELGPGDGLELGGGVELHSARAQRDHAAVERVVLVGEAAQVAHHRRLGVVRAEDRVREVVARAGQRLGPGRSQVAGHRTREARAEGLDDRRDLRPVRRLVEGQLHRVGVHAPQVEVALERRRHDSVGAAGHRDREGVEVVLGAHVDGRGDEGLARGGGVPLDALGDAPQPLGTVPDGIHAGHDGQQHLGGADVGGGLLPPDVLLSRLQGEPVCRSAHLVDGHPHEAAGHGPLEALADRHEAGVGTTEAHRDPEPLAVAHRDVGAPLAGRRQQGQGEQVGGGGHEGLGLVGGLGQGAPVAHLAVGAGVLHEDAEDALAAGGLEQPLGRGHGRQVQPLHLDAERQGARCDHGVGLRQHLLVDQQHGVLGRLAGPPHQGHGLGGRRALVEQGRVGDVEPGQVVDHGLEVEQGLEPALADLGLVGRVGGVPRGVLEHVAPHDGRRHGAVVAEADERGLDLVAVGDRAQLVGDGLLGGGSLEREGRAPEDGGRCGAGDELLDAGLADDLQHARDVVLARADVAGDELRHGGGAVCAHGRLLVAGGHRSGSPLRRVRPLQSATPGRRIQGACPRGPGA